MLKPVVTGPQFGRVWNQSAPRCEAKFKFVRVARIIGANVEGICIHLARGSCSIIAGGMWNGQQHP